MTEKIFIRAEIQGELLSGQKVVHLLANNVDGFVFCTDDKSIVRPQEIETTVNEFWGELQKLSIAKGKEKPTLEELLEYIEQAKAEAIKEFATLLKTKETTAIHCHRFEGVVSTDDIDCLAEELAGTAGAWTKANKEMVGDTDV